MHDIQVEFRKCFPNKQFKISFCKKNKLEIYSNKKETFDFHGTVSFDPAKMLQQKYNQNVNQTSDTRKMVIIWFYLLILKC